MRTFFKVFVVLTLALFAWLAWSLKPAAKIPVVAAQALPADFMWGVSSSAYQSEGGDVDSNWSRWNASQPTQDRYGKAIDFRHRYREDVALARDLGVNTFRLGINWARIEPKKGQIDQAELAYYDDLILAIKQAGMKPLVTLDHFVYPGWVADQGGWVNPQTVDDFLKYANLIVGRYQADVDLWITFNEAAFGVGGEKNIRQLSWSDTGHVRDNIAAAHRQAYDLIHRLDDHATVTSNIYWMGDRFGSGAINGLLDWTFLDLVADKCDVIAVDYYAADIPKVMRAGVETHWNWPVDPAGLYRALKMLQARYPDKPLLIAEIGMSTQDGAPRADGTKREDMIRDTVYWTQRARADGVNVIGYMVWSLTDNFEWGSYTPRFGLYTVNALKDPELKRIPTAAVPAYKEVIRNHGVGADYRPVLPQ